MEYLLLVNGVDGGCESSEDGGGSLWCGDLFAEFGGESGAGDEFEDEGEPTGSFFDSIEPCEVWVLHTGRDVNFGEPAFSVFVDEGRLGGEEFEGDFSVCGEFESEPDDGSGTVSEGFYELAVGEDLVGGRFSWSLEEQLWGEILAAMGGIELELELAIGAGFDVVFEVFAEEWVEGVLLEEEEELGLFGAGWGVGVHADSSREASFLSIWWTREKAAHAAA